MLYIKQVSSFYFLKNSLLPTQKKGNKLLGNIIYFSQINIYSYYLFKSKNSLNYVQFLFMIKSNSKQYFLSFLGFNVLFFKTVSTGKLLKKKKLVTKSLKSSSRANKYLLLFFNEYNTIPSVFISYYLLKPINRKNLNFYYLISKTYKIISEFIGFRYYYKVVHKTVRRVKKRVKKKLLSKHTYYN